MIQIKGASTIAEYAIMRWMHEHNFEMSCFKLTMRGNEGTIEDRNGDTLTLVYEDREVTVKE